MVRVDALRMAGSWCIARPSVRATSPAPSAERQTVLVWDTSAVEMRRAPAAGTPVHAMEVVAFDGPKWDPGARVSLVLPLTGRRSSVPSRSSECRGQSDFVRRLVTAVLSTLPATALPPQDHSQGALTTNVVNPTTVVVISGHADAVATRQSNRPGSPGI